MAEDVKWSSAADPQEIADLGFLISQVGFHSQSLFGKLIEPLGLRRAHVGILRAIHAAHGPTQRQLGDRLGIFASNLVGLIDELERMGLLERLRHSGDRRSYRIQLTAKGERWVDGIIAKVREHQTALCAALTIKERYQLHRLLEKIAGDQGLRPGIHPDISEAAKRQPRSRRRTGQVETGRGG